METLYLLPPVLESNKENTFWRLNSVFIEQTDPIFKVSGLKKTISSNYCRVLIEPKKLVRGT